MSLSEPFIRRPVATVLVAFTILAFGLWARRTLPVSDMPDVAYPVIMVTTQWPGADAARTTEELGVTFRPAAETYADTLRWMYRAGHLDAKHVGLLSED